MTVCEICEHGICRTAEVTAERRRREIYAKNAIMKQWVQRNMRIFEEQMIACRTDADEAVGFGV